jgi:hypothetical protein
MFNVAAAAGADSLLRTGTKELTSLGGGNDCSAVCVEFCTPRPHLRPGIRTITIGTSLCTVPRWWTSRRSDEFLAVHQECKTNSP